MSVIGRIGGVGIVTVRHLRATILVTHGKTEHLKKLKGSSKIKC